MKVTANRKVIKMNADTAATVAALLAGSNAPQEFYDEVAAYLEANGYDAAKLFVAATLAEVADQTR